MCLQFISFHENQGRVSVLMRCNAMFTLHPIGITIALLAMPADKAIMICRYVLPRMH